jgi:hypothetical protein
VSREEESNSGSTSTLIVISAAALCIVGLAAFYGSRFERSGTLAPAAAPVVTVHALWDGVPVWKTPIGPGDKPLKTLRYGEPVSATCDERDCLFRVDGVEAEVGQFNVSRQPPPSRVQYAVRDTEVYSDPLYGKPKGPRVKAGKRVEVIAFNGKMGTPRVKIGDEEWVSATDLQDHPETEEERHARLAVEERDQEVKRAQLRQQEEATQREAALKLGLRQNVKTSLREKYLDAGLDIKVAVSGKNADRLKLQYVLFNDVWSHRFEKEGEIQAACEMGFKRVEMSNGYDWGYRWTCG